MTALRKPTSSNAENQRTLARACPLNDALPRLGARWKMQVLHRIAHGTASFGALKRALPGVSDHLLATRLRELAGEGLIVRAVLAASPATIAPRSAYRCTPRGARLLAIMEQLCAWEAEGGTAGGL